MKSQLLLICLAVLFPALCSADWIPTGSLTAAREGHTAVLLADGRLMVIGGTAAITTEYSFTHDGRPKNTAEIYDPVSGAWTATGSLQVARQGFTATLLPDGRVLVVGGAGDSRSAELYDPTAGTWRATAPLIFPRAVHTATLLPNGNVLVIGGFQRANFIASAELFDPVTETWRMTAPPAVVTAHFAILLPNGKVLAVGNRDCVHPKAEIYEPVSEQWNSTHYPPIFGCLQRAVLLRTGEVLTTNATRAQLYNPDTGEWAETAGPKLVGGTHSLTVLSTGQVLAVGGQAGDFSTNGAELFDRNLEQWIPIEPLPRCRASHTATLLGDGRVLIAGGFDGSCCDWRYTLDSAELFEMPEPR